MPLKGAAYTLHETYKTYRDLVAKPALSPEESLTRAKVRNILVNDAGEPEVRDIDKLLTIR
jgi:hypothetical protein